MKSLRLMIYDDTCRGAFGLPGLTHSWWAGARLYRALGRLDAHKAVRTWHEGLEWLAAFEPHRPIGEIQFWGHGKWGCAFVDRRPLDVSALSQSHELHSLLCAIRDRLAPDALWWFRTCETFGASAGHRFARAWTDFFGCRAAGHTFIIGPWQSGLHSLSPGIPPGWSTTEGLKEGTADAPARARWSHPFAPNTITCFHGEVPDGF